MILVDLLRLGVWIAPRILVASTRGIAALHDPVRLPTSDIDVHPDSIRRCLSNIQCRMYMPTINLRQYHLVTPSGHHDLTDLVTYSHLDDII